MNEKTNENEESERPRTVKSGKKQIAVRFTMREIEEINSAVGRGYGLSPVDFVRTATREKLDKVRVPAASLNTVQMVFPEEVV